MPGTTGAQVSGAGGCAQIRPELGVYVLGAITPAGRAVVGRHLVSCPRCRDEVAGLAGIPAMLRRVPVAAERFDLFESWWEWLREFQADRAGRPS